MKQQTAVEWLVKEFNLEEFKATIEFAKAMEKEQIIDAHEEGIQRCYLDVDDFGARLVKPIEGIAGQDYYYFKYETNGL